MTSEPRPPQRVDPPLAGDEVSTLRGFLDYHRDTLRLKTAGLDHEQLNRSLDPSTMTLAGLLKHLAVVDSSWFSEDFLGQSLMPPFDTAPWDEDRDWEWHTAIDDSPEYLRELFDDAVRRSDEILDAALANAQDGADPLDAPSARPDRSGGHYSLRWILVHLIEEYARHNGHADLLREAIDGSVGD